MNRIFAFASCLVLSLWLAPFSALAACSAHSDESTAGLCGSPRDTDLQPDTFGACGTRNTVACTGALERARDAAGLVVRYRAIGRANLTGCATRH